MSGFPTTQLLIISFEAIIIALLVLFLFHIRTRFGLSPLYVTLGVFQPIQVLLASSVYVEILPGVVVSPGSVVMFTASLFAILLVYIREDAVETRKVIYGILLANITMTALLYIFGVQLDRPDTINTLLLSREIFNQNARVMLAGTLVLFADALLIIFVYEAIFKFITRNLFLRIYMTMALILIFDSLAFATGAFYGLPGYIEILRSGIIGKLGVAAFYASALTIYLRISGPAERQSLALNDIFNALTFRQKYEVERQRGLQMEDSLRLIEAEYRSIFDNAPVGIFQSTLDGKFLKVNQTMAKIYGYSSPEEMIASVKFISRQIYIEPEMREEFKRLMAENGEVTDFENQEFRKDGSIIWTSTIARAVKDAENQIIYYEGFLIDITGHKQAEEALKEQEIQLQKIVSNFPDVIYRYRTRPQPTFEFVSPSISKITGYTPEEHYSNPDLGFRIIHPEDRVKLMEMMDGKLPDIPHIIRWIRNDGKILWMEDRFTPIYDEQGELVGIEGVARDITDRKQAEETLEQRYKELSAIYYASRRMHELFAPDQLAQAIIDVLENTLGYTYGAVLLLNETTGALEPFAISDQDQGPDFIKADMDFIRSKDVGTGKGITGWVAEHGESVRLDDVRSDPRYLAVREDIRSEMCVPLKVQNQVIGVVNVESTQANTYSEEDQRVLETVAAIIAVGTHNMRLLDELVSHRDQLAELSRRLVEAYETEQRAIGRELHDQVGQMLTALKLTLEIVQKLPAEKAFRKLVDAQELVNDLLSRVSQLSLELRPPMLDDLGLIPALVWHVNRFQDQSRIKVDFKHSGVEGRRFDPETETTAYRVIQEALTNAARHSNANSIRLQVRASNATEEIDRVMVIQVEDNGLGFDPQAELGKYRGLSGMRERVGLLNGSFRIESQAGTGTLISISLPLKETSE